MNILLLNAGSSGLKYTLMESADSGVVGRGLVGRGPFRVAAIRP
jgi:acetate kinase